MLPDEPPFPREYERFGSKLMNPKADEVKGDGEIPQVRMRLHHKADKRTIHFQPNKLVYAWGRTDLRPSYDLVKEEFVRIFNRLSELSAVVNLPSPVVDLWELTYTNSFPKGYLWESPSDWHKILPKLFPKPELGNVGYEWSSFTGEWFYEIAPKRGRVRVKVQKSVANHTDEIVLLLIVSARGAGPEEAGTLDWQSELEIGHKSALNVFRNVVSLEVQKKWGVKS